METLTALRQQVASAQATLDSYRDQDPETVQAIRERWKHGGALLACGGALQRSGTAPTVEGGHGRRAQAMGQRWPRRPPTAGWVSRLGWPGTAAAGLKELSALLLTLGWGCIVAAHAHHHVCADNLHCLTSWCKRQFPGRESDLDDFFVEVRRRVPGRAAPPAQARSCAPTSRCALHCAMTPGAERVQGVGQLPRVSVRAQDLCIFDQRSYNATIDRPPAPDLFSLVPHASSFLPRCCCTRCCKLLLLPGPEGPRARSSARHKAGHNAMASSIAGKLLQRGGALLLSRCSRRSPGAPARLGAGAAQACAAVEHASLLAVASRVHHWRRRRRNDGRRRGPASAAHGVGRRGAWAAGKRAVGHVPRPAGLAAGVCCMRLSLEQPLLAHTGTQSGGAARGPWCRPPPAAAFATSGRHHLLARGGHGPQRSRSACNPAQMLTRCVTCGLLNGLGDVLSQLLIEQRSTFDTKRFAIFTSLVRARQAAVCRPCCAIFNGTPTNGSLMASPTRAQRPAVLAAVRACAGPPVRGPRAHDVVRLPRHLGHGDGRQRCAPRSRCGDRVVAAAARPCHWGRGVTGKERCAGRRPCLAPRLAVRPTPSATARRDRDQRARRPVVLRPHLHHRLHVADEGHRGATVFLAAGGGGPGVAAQ